MLSRVQLIHGLSRNGTRSWLLWATNPLYHHRSLLFKRRFLLYRTARYMILSNNLIRLPSKQLVMRVSLQYCYSLSWIFLYGLGCLNSQTHVYWLIDRRLWTGCENSMTSYQSWFHGISKSLNSPKKTLRRLKRCCRSQIHDLILMLRKDSGLQAIRF